MDKLEWFSNCFRNTATTVAGIVTGALYYWDSVGVQIPTNKSEATKLGVAMAIAGLGYVAKSANVGSTPQKSQ